MKNYIITAVILLLAAFVFSGSTVRYVGTPVDNKFENMVAASVLIYDDYGYGSGVFIHDNVIVTAAHCLVGEEVVNIELSDGTILESSDFYIDEEEDVGFIFVEADEPGIAVISKMPNKLGDTVFTVGAPHDEQLKFTLTKGIISYLDRDMFHWNDLIQTDASVGLGSSGGPLYDSNGDLIGICVARPPQSGGSIGLYESVKSILEAYERKAEVNSESKG